MKKYLIITRERVAVCQNTLYYHMEPWLWPRLVLSGAEAPPPLCRLSRIQLMNPGLTGERLPSPIEKIKSISQKNYFLASILVK